MTDDELKAILEKCDHNDNESYMESCFDVSDDARALAAEVRRLRALVKAAEWFSGVGAYDSESGCPWCGSDGFYEHSKLGKGRHEAKCPAFTEGGDVR